MKCVQASNWIIQYSRFQDSGGNPQHSEPFSVGDTAVLSNAWTVRYNQFIDPHGTGMMVFCGANWKFYGNYVWTTNTGLHAGADRVSSSGVFGSWTDQPNQNYIATNAQVYNNTFYAVRTVGNTGVNFDDGVSANQNEGGADLPFIRNNIWVNCEDVVSTLGGGTASHNYFYNNSGSSTTFGTDIISGTEDPFMDAANQDFTLKYALGGFDLDTEFNLDVLGSPRGFDGTWDVGAFEHDDADGTPPPPTVTPSLTPTATFTGSPSPTPTPIPPTPIPTNTPPLETPVPTNTPIVVLVPVTDIDPGVPNFQDVTIRFLFGE